MVVNRWHVPVRMRAGVNREARCGYCGQRVGEAAHPGLVRRPCKMADVRNVFPRLGTQSTMVDSDDDRPLLRAVSPRLDAVHPFCHDDGHPWGPEPPSRRVVLVPQLSDTPQSFHHIKTRSQAPDCAQFAFGVPSQTEAEQGNQHRSEVTLSVFVGEAHPFTVDVDVASTAECCAHHGPQPFRRVGTGRDPTARA